MNRANFLNFDALQSVTTKVGFTGSGFKDARLFIVDKEYKIGIKVSPGFSNLHAPKSIKLQKGRSLTNNSDTFYLPGIPLQPKYPNGVLIKPDKLCDIKLLIKFVKDDYLDFYTELFRQQDIDQQVPGQQQQQQESNPNDPDRTEDDLDLAS